MRKGLRTAVLCHTTAVLIPCLLWNRQLILCLVGVRTPYYRGPSFQVSTCGVASRSKPNIKKQQERSSGSRDIGISNKDLVWPVAKTICSIAAYEDRVPFSPPVSNQTKPTVQKWSSIPPRTEQQAKPAISAIVSM